MKRSGSSDNKHHKQVDNSAEGITLPYDFLPFAADRDGGSYKYPYAVSDVPKHNEQNQDRLSGALLYTITPYSDVSLELRTSYEGIPFISGSQLRGRVRANLEILSDSYPEFVDRSEMLYRNVTKNSYRDKLFAYNSKEDKLVEKVVRAGYLTKEGTEFYIIPAKPIGYNNFLSIKEHVLVHNGVLNNKNQLFHWEMKETKKLYDLECAINKLTTRIRNEKARLGDKWNESIKEIYTSLFLEYNISKRLSHLKRNLDGQIDIELQKLKDKLLLDLKRRVSSDQEFTSLYEMSVERWGLKAEVYLSYQKKIKIKQRIFMPYQQGIGYKLSASHGVMEVSRSISEEYPIKGYLYNSTNASSKRSHYLINAECTNELIHVPQDVINSYNVVHKRMRFNTKSDDTASSNDKAKPNDIEQMLKGFYDIFNGYDRLKQQAKGNPIVFFVYDETKDSLRLIGRTPYFKVPYHYQPSELMGVSDHYRLDYANALFGYIAEKNDVNEVPSYKSRVRFSPVNIVGDLRVFNPTEKAFLLPSPSASAAGMYLKYDGINLPSYEEDNSDKTRSAPKLNGYKYYHALNKTIPYSEQKTAMESKRKVIEQSENITLVGKVYFSNLSKDELGLLILSLDITKLQTSSEYRVQVEKIQNLDQAYELIGGAKPYGYGKVKISIDEVHLEQKETIDFESLVLDQQVMLKGEEIASYIDAFINHMGKENYFNLQQAPLYDYIHSKQIFNNYDPDTHFNWTSSNFSINKDDSTKKSEVGYNKNYYLKTTTPSQKNQQK